MHEVYANRCVKDFFGGNFVASNPLKDNAHGGDNKVKFEKKTVSLMDQKIFRELNCMQHSISPEEQENLHSFKKFSLSEIAIRSKIAL